MKITEKEFLGFIDSFKNSLDFYRYKSLLINPEFYFDDFMKRSYGLIKYVYNLDLEQDFLYVNTDFFNKTSPFKNLNWEIRVIEQGRNKEVDCRPFHLFYGLNKRSFVRWGDGFDLTLTNINLKINVLSQLRNLSLIGGNLIFDLNTGICNRFLLDDLFSDYHFISIDTIYYMNEFVYSINDWEDIEGFKIFQSMISSKKYIIKKPLVCLDLFSLSKYFDLGVIWKLLDTIYDLNVNHLRIVIINYGEEYYKDFCDELKIRNRYIPLYSFDIEDVLLDSELTFDAFFDDSQSDNLK